MQHNNNNNNNKPIGKQDMMGAYAYFTGADRGYGVSVDLVEWECLIHLCCCRHLVSEA